MSFGLHIASPPNSGPSGTVTSVSGVNTNGFTWSIATSTTTPAITLSLQDATTSQSGKLNSTDWNTFNNKLSTATAASTYAPINNPVFTGAVTVAADPVSGLQVATKSYVDNALTGITWKQEVKAATTANITLSGPQTVDGVALIAGDRCLVKNQTSAIQNGIYLVAAGAWTRTTDADTTAEIETATVFIRLGTVNADTQWTCTNSNEPVIGVDNITFGQIAGAGTYTNGSGITLTGNVFSIASGAITNTMIASMTSAQLATIVSDETGSGALVFATSPTLVTPILGVATGTSLAVTGSIASSGTAGIGYSTGAGGTVTQATNRTTGVVITKVCGRITTNNTSLAALTSATFTVTNSLFAIADNVIVSIRSGQTNKETLAYVSAKAAGTFDITIFNVNAITAETGAILLEFTIFKGTTT